MKNYILKDRKGNKAKLRVKDNKVYLVKRKLRKEVLYVLLVLLIIILGVIIAYNILY